MKKLIRTIHPETRIIDAAKGIVDYVASDETIDSYNEVIRAAGWRFTDFNKNAPFVDSHDYSTIEKLLGSVIDFRVEGGRLIERVQWAIDVPENRLAQIGWKMTVAGHLKAVSVGFYPSQYLTPNSQGWKEELASLGLKDNDGVRCIYTEQEQVELSACIIGANPNALAKSLNDGAISADDFVFAYRSTTPNKGNHFIEKCSCVKMISQCRCPGPKETYITEHGCPECKSAASLTVAVVNKDNDDNVPEAQANASEALGSGLASWASDQTRQRLVRKIQSAANRC